MPRCSAVERMVVAALFASCAIANGALGAATLTPVVGAASALADASTPRLALKDPDGHLVDPFLAAENSAAIVFVFASVDCPVSNRYAPEVQRIHAAFASKNVAFWLVYPNPSDTPDAVRAHLTSYGYPVHALLDPRHDLAKLTKVTITPEVAVFDRLRALVYHGRIDDKFVSLGVERPSATRRDLFDALTAVIGGGAPAQASAPAVGCFIADFVP